MPELARHLMDFGQHYRTLARPFQWTFTRCAPATRQAELHLIRSRLRGGLENKARRGELRLALPIGLEYDETGEIRLSPDEQIRAAIGRIYALWDRCGSARQVVAELARRGQLLPRRAISERRVRWVPADYGRCMTC